MASFDENGKYIKTNWKAGDKITATKLNKIEESIEAVNDNDISRHVEADARLDALEAKDVAHDKEFTNIKNTIADNKAAAELGDYEINSRMQFLEDDVEQTVNDMNSAVTTIRNEMNTVNTNVNNKISAFETEFNAEVAGLKAVDETIQNDVSEIQNDVSEIQNNMANTRSQIDALENNLKYELKYDQFDNGYYILPGGLIIQFGYVTFPANYSSSETIDYVFTLPLEIPNRVITVISSMSGGDDGWDSRVSGHALDNSRLRIVMRGLNYAITNTMYWLVIGR